MTHYTSLCLLDPKQWKLHESFKTKATLHFHTNLLLHKEARLLHHQHQEISITTIEETMFKKELPM